MTQPIFARWAGRLLTGDDARDEARPIDEREREQAIGAIEHAIRERGRQKTRRLWAIRLASVAAAIFVGGLATLPFRTPAPATTAALAPAADAVTIVAHVSGGGAGTGTTIYSRPGSASSLKDGEPIAAGSRITARNGSRATLAFSTGTQLSVEDGGDMTIVEEGRSQIFSLGAGEMRAHVAKLGADERFVVRTPDADVEVRGTSFSVALAPADPSCGGGTVTRVVVAEGVVAVRHGSVETFVTKGQEWPAGCGLTFENADSNDTSSDGNDPPNAPFARRSDRHANSGSNSASNLAAQNNLFAEALSYKNGGQHAAAVATFERFTAKYPSSNLAENAAVERMKLLLVDDRPRGVEAAKQYLRRYPDGFAKSDAKAAVAGNP